MWGKSEEEINAAIEEWKANRKSKEQAEVSRKDQVRASLIAEEKEVKKQIKQKWPDSGETGRKHSNGLPRKQPIQTELKQRQPTKKLPLNKWSLPPRKQPIRARN